MGGGDSDEEEEVQSDVLDEDNFQLALPSGRYIWHPQKIIKDV